MRVYYHSDGVTDLGVIRDAALYRLTKNNEESLIHLHPKGEGSCFNSEGNLDVLTHEWVLRKLSTTKTSQIDPATGQADPAKINPETGMNEWVTRTGF